MIKLVFIHGLGGDEKSSWGKFPLLLESDDHYVDEMSIKFYSYPTSILRVPLISTKASSIQDISESFGAFLELQYSKSDQLIIVAHSMGGLVARKYLIEREKGNKNTPNILGLIMFATPNNGAQIASIGKYISIGNSHLKQLCKNSDFINSINNDWEAYNINDKYEIFYLGGLIDKIVQPNSAKHYWGNSNWKLLPNKGHKDIIKPINHQDVSYLSLSLILNKFIFKTPFCDAITSDRFSKNLIKQFTSTGKIIDMLTEEQFNVINSLKGVNKALIHGCAGSGKTLVATEKAIRLDRAGLNVLFVCNNPLLANYLSDLLVDSSVDVYCFNDWVSSFFNLNHNLSSDFNEWSHHIEPTEEEIITAYENIKGIYDAVIVDEGQDFKTDWWALLESSLKDPINSTFYIFSDDNQSLLPNRGNYPISNPYFLGKNCRNSGEIFKMVRRFHPSPPGVSPFLKDTGIFKETKCSTTLLLPTFKKALRETINNVGIDDLIILTSEFEDLELTDLANLKVFKQPSWSWSGSINIYLKRAKRLIRDCILKRIQYKESKSFFKKQSIQISYVLDLGVKELKEHLDHLELITLPSFSDDILPTKNDIRKVSDFIKSISSSINISSLDKTKGLVWSVKENKLILHYKKIIKGRIFSSENGYPKLINNDTLYSNASMANLVIFLGYSNWWEFLPPIEHVTIVPYTKYIPKSNGIIPLYNIASFKGLESDSALVYVKSGRDKFDTNLYVAISRARFYIHLVIDRSSHSISDKL